MIKMAHPGLYATGKGGVVEAVTDFTSQKLDALKI